MTLANFAPQLRVLAVVAATLLAAVVTVQTSRRVVARAQGRRWVSGLSMRVSRCLKRRSLGPDRASICFVTFLTLSTALAVWVVIPLGPMGLLLLDAELGAFFLVGAAALLPLLTVWTAARRGDTGLEVSPLGTLLPALLRGLGGAVLQGVAILTPGLLAGSLSLQALVHAQTLPYLLAAPLPALLYLLAGVALLGRRPFLGDIPLSSPGALAPGSVEYSCGPDVAVLFHAYTFAVAFALLFLGGWRGPGVSVAPWLGGLWLFLKAFVVFNGLALALTATPRLRSDQVLSLLWTVGAPLGGLTLLLTALVDATLKVLAIETVWAYTTILLLTNTGLGLIALKAIGLTSQAHLRTRSFQAVSQEGRGG